jgi:hypothetical protein
MLADIVSLVLLMLIRDSDMEMVVQVNERIDLPVLALFYKIRENC